MFKGGKATIWEEIKVHAPYEYSDTSDLMGDPQKASKNPYNLSNEHQKLALFCYFAQFCPLIAI